MEDLKREIERLKEAKRRALQLADERAQESTALRAEIKQLKDELREMAIDLAAALSRSTP